MKTLFAALFAITFMFVAAQVKASCYSGSNWKKDGNIIYVCIKGDETWDNRHKAEALCSKITSSKCDPVSTYSSSCSNGNCYDESGNKHNSLSGY